MPRIVYKYRGIDQICGHCKKRTRTLNVIHCKNKHVITCNKCAEDIVTKKRK